MNDGRVKKSTQNMTMGFLNQLLSFLLSFLSRTVFIRTLGTEYLGLNGIFADVLSLLSMADLGFGTAMAYSFYKPLAEHDEEKLAALITFYRKAYRIIAVIVTTVGLAIVPFLRYLVNTQEDIPYLEIYYLFSLAGVVISYLFVYKTTILTADQKNYKIVVITIGTNLVKTLLQILVLVLWQNYIIYLAVNVAAQFVINIVSSRKADKEYPFIKNKIIIDTKESGSIFTNMKSVFLYKISSTMFTATDNILISIILGTAVVGLYSNYLMVSTKLLLILQIIFSALTASIGNVMVKESPKKRYEIFMAAQSVSFILCGIITCMYCLLVNDLVNVWLGEEYTISFYAVLAITLNTYLSCVLQPLWTYRDAVGLYIRTKYVMLAGALLNIVLSILLGKLWGLGGIIFSSAVSRLSTYFWYEPKLLFKEYFNKNAGKYYISLLLNGLLVVLTIVPLTVAFSIFKADSWIKLIIKGGITGCVCTVIFLAAYAGTEGFNLILKKAKLLVEPKKDEEITVDKKMAEAKMMEKQALVSIIIPVRGNMPDLDRCMESVSRQTYDNLEIIVVDMEPEALFPSCYEKYTAADSRIKVLSKKTNSLSDARNVGIDMANGEFIGFVDGVDYVHARMVELLCESICRNNADIAICGYYTEINNRLTVVEPPIDVEKVMTSEEAVSLLLDAVIIKSFAWDKLYRKELFNNLRYKEDYTSEDNKTSYQLLRRADRVCMIPDYLYYFQLDDPLLKRHVNDSELLLGRIEQYEYLEEEQDSKLREAALAAIVRGITGYLETVSAMNKDGQKDMRRFLAKKRDQIQRNPYLRIRFKVLANIFTLPRPMNTIYFKLEELKNKSYTLQKTEKQLIGMLKEKPDLDFSLKAGKKVRIFLFELPCADNLGDHAIAYAESKFFNDLCEEYPMLQLITINGRDSIRAVEKLKKELRFSDIIICHGGGNIGNLYQFAEETRYLIMRAFRNNFILVFPQTVYFSNDAAGRRALAVSRKIYDSCTNLTLLGRDEFSYEKMKRYYHATSKSMIDIVTYLDERKYASLIRDKVLLCLRSDIESALLAADKKFLIKLCDRLFEKTIITDTVNKVEIPLEKREAALVRKWKLFGSAGLVITDRLHGMIFAMITGTPCIALENSYHKVKDAYKTMQQCTYLRYAENLDQVEALAKELMQLAYPLEKPDFQKEFNELKAYVIKKISDCLHVS